MDRIAKIRLEEKLYHDHFYEKFALFEKGSWLYKPVQTVLDIIPYFKGVEPLEVLDLGAGVGRNSIPIAEAISIRTGCITCVDLLDSAIEKLKEYSKIYQVEDRIQVVKQDIATFQIKPNTYDFIIAVSSLEHVRTESELDYVLHGMAEGTKQKGINCIIINSEVEEIDIKTGLHLEAQMEVNLRTADMTNKLKKAYQSWSVMKHVVKPLEYTIERQGKPVLMKTKAITYVVKNDARL
ncbi:class I SAM-dependent methyltransferase [Oceanobacillus kimchii]|uniref:class I SAM-dependent methyltransferase n=1 Tax=Oceanobacillus kimchii TaxID=746691 RepID=UPI0021A5D38D|nr:class I SAM-dependent methyltransferase [Oceanobacillus kimchii]MCT1577710.1 class I SAM-dependent methyltransferase [Oceanobacillus kimchii]MCT2136698.1 class I SAM-dependent methyltransferase [Oceanobacillus kimchii]